MTKHEATLLAAGSKTDPCLPLGYKSTAGLTGSGNWEACKGAAKLLLPKEKCTFSSCSLGNVFTPPLDGPIIGIDNFFYVSFDLESSFQF
jgi:apyrase